MVTALITLLLLIYSLIILYRRYSIKVILHPAAYFLIMWIISVLSFILFYTAGLDLIFNESILNELFTFVSFTAISVLFWDSKRKVSIKKSAVKLRLTIPEVLFKPFVIIFFVSAVFLLFQSGLDVARNREIININNVQNLNSSLGILDLILGVITMLSLPFTVYSGFKLGDFYIRGVRKVKYFYYLPLLTNIIQTISGGGRAGIVSSFLMFLIGFSLGFFSYKSIGDLKQKIKPLIKYVIIVFVLFSMYSGFVSSQRSKLESRGEQSSYISVLLSEYPLLSSVSGTLEYLVFHFQGYQWRRDDSVSKNIEWGKNTFAFITQFNVPILSQLLGQNISIENLFDIKYIDSVTATQNQVEENKMGSSITATVYLVFYKDFGFWGTLVVIFFFVGFTQKIFERLFTHNNRSFWSILLFLAIYKLWTLTFFQNHLNDAWFNSFLYPILIIEVINSYMKKLTIHTNKRFVNNINIK